MSKGLLVLFFICVAIIAYKKINGHELKFVVNYPIKTTLSDYKVDQSPQIEKCLSQKNCIYIYVAPWCPACHAFIKQYPFIKSKLNESQIETLFIVGADENRSNEVAMKEELGSEAVLDTIQGDFRKLNRVDSFPYVIVVEPNNKVIAVGSDGYNFINKIINKR